MQAPAVLGREVHEREDVLGRPPRAARRPGRSGPAASLETRRSCAIASAWSGWGEDGAHDRRDGLLMGSCQDVPESTLLIASRRPSCASEISRRTPPRPRETSERRNSVQKAFDSAGPASTPRMLRCPCAEQPSSPSEPCEPSLLGSHQHSNGHALDFLVFPIERTICFGNASEQLVIVMARMQQDHHRAALSRLALVHRAL